MSGFFGGAGAPDFTGTVGSGRADGAQDFANGVPEAIAFPLLLKDADGAFDGRIYTVPAGGNGHYLVTCGIRTSAMDAGSRYQLRLVRERLNASNVVIYFAVVSPNPNILVEGCGGGCIIPAIAGDKMYIELEYGGPAGSTMLVDVFSAVGIMRVA